MPVIYYRKRAYTSYLASQTWHTKRNAALQRAGQRCQWVDEGERCAVTAGLHVHHVSYPRLKPLGLSLALRAGHMGNARIRDVWPTDKDPDGASPISDCICVKRIQP